jgi:hypothetical protein
VQVALFGHVTAHADNVLVFYCNVQCFFFFALDRATSPRLVETTSSETIAYWPLIDIVVDNRGNFGGRSTIEDNEISELLRGSQPEVLVEFRSKLTQWHWVESDTV